MLRSGSVTSLCALALWMGGCPKRQGPARIVYVPSSAPPSLTVTPKAAPAFLVIAEPETPPEPPEEPTPPPVAADPKPAPRPRRPVRTDAAVEPAEPPAAPDTGEPPPAEVPALAPRESTEQEAALRQQIQKLHEEVRQRMSRLNVARLNSTERKTLEDASTFYVQSTHALALGDLQRSLNLARKASLLITALE